MSDDSILTNGRCPCPVCASMASRAPAPFARCGSRRSWASTTSTFPSRSGPPARASRNTSPSILTAGCRRSTMTDSSVGVARDHALSREEARPPLSGDARGRGQGLAVEPLGGAGGRPRRQHLVADAVRLPPADRDPERLAEALKVLAAPFKVLDGALAGRPYCSGPISPSPISTWPRSSAARSTWILPPRPASATGSGAASNGRRRSRPAGCGPRPTLRCRSRYTHDRPQQSLITPCPGAARASCCTGERAGALNFSSFTRAGRSGPGRTPAPGRYRRVKCARRGCARGGRARVRGRDRHAADGRIPRAWRGDPVGRQARGGLGG